MLARGSNRRVLGASIAACAGFALLVACGSGDVVIGDDTSASPADVDGGATDGASGDATPKPDAAPDGGPPDAPPVTCESILGACQAQGTACMQADTSGATCANAGDFCCKTTCPTLSPPAPSFCDGGTPVPKYGSGKCIVGYGCAPLGCTEAGGQCVALTPGSCPSNHVGDAQKYSCGGGLGVMCCLP
jgi:hypothetical protein